MEFNLSHNFYSIRLTDYRDSYGVLITPLLLSLGVCSTLWIEVYFSLPEFTCSAHPAGMVMSRGRAATGLIAIGVGDSLAAIVGVASPINKILPGNSRGRTFAGEIFNLNFS